VRVRVRVQHRERVRVRVLVEFRVQEPLRLGQALHPLYRAN